MKFCFEGLCNYFVEIMLNLIFPPCFNGFNFNTICCRIDCNFLDIVTSTN